MVLKAKTENAESREDPIYVPAAKLDGPVVNTTGAGDCFTGYFVTGLMELEDERKEGGKTPATVEDLSREEIKTVLEKAVQAAGLCVQRRGAMDSIPNRSEVEVQ